MNTGGKGEVERIVKECLFCRGRAGNKEHIFAGWLITRMQAEKESIVVAHRSAKEVLSRKRHLISGLTTKAICKKCNNGWMSDLEAGFQRHLGFLVERHWSKLAQSCLFAAATESKLVAKWALKTLICLGHAGIKSDVVKPHIAHDLFRGILPAAFYVRLAMLRTPDIGALITQGLPMRNGSNFVQWQEHRDGEAFKAVFALNHLAIGLLRIPNAKPVYVSWEGSLPVLCYPNTERIERDCFKFSTVESFDASIEGETWLGCN